MPLSVLQFGNTGQVARELLAAADYGDVAIRAVARSETDFMRASDVADTVHRYPADIVVNAVAYTAVDKAETEPEMAHAVNVSAVGAMAQACASRNVPLIHISTDYVFDGTKAESYIEDDAANPLSVYGLTKWEGEENIRRAAGPHVILRTSWVYSRHGSNFPKTILRLAAQRDHLNIVCDQKGAPTSAADIAASILTIARQLKTNPTLENCGTFHYAGSPDTNWHEFAQSILAKARDWAPTRAVLSAIPASSYPTAARRPSNSSLNCAKLARTYGILPASWQESLGRVLDQLKMDQEAH